MSLLTTIISLLAYGIAITSLVQSRKTDENKFYNGKRSSVIQHLLSRRQRSISTSPQPCFKNFFVKNMESTGFRSSSANLKYICQQIPGDATVYFGSLFDTSYGIPIYSAYLITAANAANIESGKDRNYPWRTESGISVQGTDALYSNQKTYAKGHLLPAAIYSFADKYVESTFTYTNAVPQVSGFNSGEWAQYERRIKEYAINTCSKTKSDLYLITGVSEARYKAGTATKEDMKMLKNTIRIPNSMWTAGCCIDTKGNVKGNFGVIGNNFKDKSKIEMTQLSVTDLQDVIKKGVGTSGGSINLFPGNAKCTDKTLQVNLNKRPGSS